MEMHQVRYFLAAAETLNFTKAAENCGVSTPSLLRGIKLLEMEFGGALFNRERSRTHLTEIGRIAYPYLLQIATSSERVRADISRTLNLDGVELRIGVMCTIAPGVLVAELQRFRTKHPKVALTIRDESARSLEALLLDGDLDLAIYALPGREPDERLHTHALYEEDMAILLSKCHPLADKPVLQPADLVNLPYVERINCEFADYGDALFASHEITGPTICRSDRDDWVLEMVAQNFGYSFMPRSTAEHPGIVTKSVEGMPLTRTIDLVTVRGRRHSPSVGAFMREIASRKWSQGRAA